MLHQLSTLQIVFGISVILVTSKPNNNKIWEQKTQRVCQNNLKIFNFVQGQFIDSKIVLLSFVETQIVNRIK